MSIERACCTCEFWDQRNFHKDKRNNGLCRINPPERNGGDYGEFSWPYTTDEDWCGRWQPREEPPPTSPHATRYTVHPDDVGKEGPGVYRRMIPVEEDE